MSADRELLLLDSLFDEIEVEREAADDHGWSALIWDGSASQLEKATAVLHVRTRLDRAFLERMPECKVIARFGTGLDTVDLTAAAERGIAVVGVRDYCIPELAAHTLGMAFVLDRRVDAIRRGTLTADSTWQEVAQGPAIPGRTDALVIGAGSIGLAVIRALVAIGLRVRVVTARPAGEIEALGAEVVALDDGIAWADFVFLHTSLSEDKEGLIDASRLGVMKAGAILVNTARLGLIDESAVAEALSSGWLGGLGLDARLGSRSPIRPLVGDDRVLLTPHVGWFSQRSARALRVGAVEAAVAAMLATEEPTTRKPRSGVPHAR